MKTAGEGAGAAPFCIAGAGAKLAAMDASLANWLYMVGCDRGTVASLPLLWSAPHGVYLT